jgi:hypothetical protein
MAILEDSPIYTVVGSGVLIMEVGWMDGRLFWDDNRIAAQSANHFKEQLSFAGPPIGRDYTKDNKESNYTQTLINIQ